MNLESGLFAFLVADKRIAQLAGSRIYPLLIPQEAALPAIAYQLISTTRGMAHDGPTGLASATMQLSIQAESYDGTKDLAEALRLALHGYSGPMGSVEIELCRLDMELDSYIFETDAKVLRQDYLILYKE